MIIGVDASNLRSGGGLTHLVALFSRFSLEVYGFSKLVVWCGPSTAGKLPVNFEWLEVRQVDAFDQGIIRRFLWRYRYMRSAVKRECDVLFSPGGIALFCCVPEVVMSRNMQPFDPEQRASVSWGYARLRLILLRYIQGFSFKKADRVIFLNSYAKQTISSLLNLPESKCRIIPHGCERRFWRLNPSYGDSACNLLYVSTLNTYKHQLEVIRAVSSIRNEFENLRLTLVGGSYEPYASTVKELASELDPEGAWIELKGKVSPVQLPEIYANSDVFIFASSCENLPNILLEAMASALPIACSEVDPMPLILQEAGVYFTPAEPESIANAVRTLLEDRDLRSRLGKSAQGLAEKYTWERCAADTLAVLHEAALTGRRKKCAE